MKKFFRRYKYKLIFIMAAAALIAVIFALFSVDGAENRRNIEFIESFGWRVDSAPTDISHMTVPEDMNSVYLIHSEISAVDGASLADCRGKTVTRYSYKVLNHSGSEKGRIRADIFVYRSDIIAADISDVSPGGSTAPISDVSLMTAAQ